MSEPISSNAEESDHFFFARVSAAQTECAGNPWLSTRTLAGDVLVVAVGIGEHGLPERAGAEFLAAFAGHQRPVALEERVDAADADAAVDLRKGLLQQGRPRETRAGEQRDSHLVRFSSHDAPIYVLTGRSPDNGH